MRLNKKKKCGICGYYRNYSRFYKNKTYRDGYEHRCKNCSKIGSFNSKSAIVGHNISYEVKKQMLEERSNICDICGELIEMETSRVDHDHNNGKVRGILCNSCNTGLGMFKDNLSNLYSAIEYLEKNMFSNT